MAKFYFDHNVAMLTAELLRHGGHNAISARDRALEAAGDEVHLLTAAQLEYVLVTHNSKDFVLLHDAWHLWSRTWNVTAAHAGVLIIPQPPLWSPNRAAQELAAFLQADVDLTNALFAWQGRHGWIRRPLVS